MIPNKHHQEDVKYVVQRCHVVLRVLGIWPSTDRQPNTLEKIENIILIIVSYFFIQCDMIPGVLYYPLVDDDPRVKIMLLPPILYSLMTFTKYSNLLIHENDIRNCLRHIKEDWRTMMFEGARELMLDKAAVSRRLFMLCFVFMYCGGVSYNTIVPLSQGSYVNEFNVTIRPLSCPGYYIFFDQQRSPAYELVFLSQVLCGVVMYTVTVAICGLAALMVMHACAQMEILMRLMEDLIDERHLEQKDVVSKLAVLVEHQIRIKNFLHLVERTMRYSNLVELLGCTTIICINLYYMLEELQNRNMTALFPLVTGTMSVTINIFILCFIGEHITNQAEEVNMTICSLDWHRLPTSTARDIILVTAVSNIPPKITAGKFVDLSFRAFGDVIKSAVIYFDMLRKLTK